MANEKKEDKKPKDFTMGNGIRKFLVKIKLLEPILGSLPTDSEIFSRFVAGKVDETIKEEELANLSQGEAESIQGKTNLPRMQYDGQEVLCVVDYQIKGFLKNAANNLKDQSGVKQARSKINNYVFIKPRRIPFLPIATEPTSVIQRPLLGMTMLGPRVSLASSELLEEGRELHFEVHYFVNKELTIETIKEYFKYGEYHGLGQWRNASFGRFEVLEFAEISQA